MQETQVQSLGWVDPLERKWQPTPVFLPGESHGQRSLATVHGVTWVGQNLATKPPPQWRAWVAVTTRMSCSLGSKPKTIQGRMLRWVLDPLAPTSQIPPLRCPRAPWTWHPQNRISPLGLPSSMNGILALSGQTSSLSISLGSPLAPSPTTSPSPLPLSCTGITCPH